MSRTLADMTPAEQQACVGMWCDNLVSTSESPSPVILSCVQGNVIWVIHADLRGGHSMFSLGRAAPRFDLLRAWTPDGKPVAGEWEQGHMRPDDGHVCRCGSNAGCPGDAPVSRFVTEWGKI